MVPTLFACLGMRRATLRTFPRVTSNFEVDEQTTVVCEVPPPRKKLCAAVEEPITKGVERIGMRGGRR